MQTEKKIRTAFNKGFKKLLNVDRLYSARRLFMEKYVDNYDVLYRKYIFRFYMRSCANKNALIQNILNSFTFLGSDFMNRLYISTH